MANKISRDPISQSPRDPFRPRLASPTMLTSRHQNAKVTAQNKTGSQLMPINSGKHEYRAFDKRPKASTQDGFGQVARRTREDGRGDSARVGSNKLITN